MTFQMGVTHHTTLKSTQNLQILNYL